MQFEQLRAFVKVAQTGSFTRAAELLGLQKSHLSRTVTQLEARLGVKLLERTTRSLRVTEVGREVLERATGILDSVDDTQRLVQNIHVEPRGSLRLTCGVEFGMIAVNAWVNAYLAAHPRVTAEVEYTSRVLDLVHEGFDVAIRVGALEESRLAARRLGDLRYGLFASPAYLARHGRPADIDDLARHPLLVFNPGPRRAGWQLRRGTESTRVDADARLRVNSGFAVHDAVLAGLGIGRVPLLIARAALAARQVVRVLPQWEPEPTPVHAVFPSQRYLTPKVRAFIDLAVAHYPDDGAAAHHQRRR